MALVLLSLCAPTTTAKQADLRADYDAIMAQLIASDAWPAYVTEAAVAGGHDPVHWPADRPLASRLQWPADGPILGRVRTLGAFIASGLRAEEARAEVSSAFDGAQIGDAGLLNDDIWALLAVPHATWSATVAQHVASNQGDDGGWSWRSGGPSDVDTTGAAVAALTARGDGFDADSVRAFLAAAKRSDGGYGVGAMPESNCNSTVWALRTLEGRDDEAWAYLHGLQVGGGYAWRVGGQANALCGAEVAVLLALAMTGHVGSPSASAWPRMERERPALAWNAVGLLVMSLVCAVVWRRVAAA